jgi:hypothetical protein
MFHKIVCIALFWSVVTGCATYDTYNKPPVVGTAALRIQRETTPDLRELFVTRTEVEQLTKRGACLVFGVMLVSEREIPIGQSRCLHEVVMQALKSAYDGQVKVVSRNTIVQTPMDTYAPERQMTMPVKPGDLVFIVGRG